MRAQSAIFYAITVFVVFVLGVGSILFYRNFLSVRINKSPLIANKANLEKYLGIDKTIDTPLGYISDQGDIRKINSITITPVQYWKDTGNCVSVRKGNERFFCFEDFVQGSKMIINVYSDPEVVGYVDSEVANRLLNLNILTILERRFNIDPERKKMILNENINNFAFIW